MATFLPRVGAELREDALTIILIIVDPKVVLSDLLPQGKEGGLTSLVVVTIVISCPRADR